MHEHIRLRDQAFGFYRRRLPHIQRPGEVIFVTFRLAGSLPESWAHADRPSGTVTEQGWQRTMSRFREEERILDAAIGPTWLNDPAVASMICGSLHHGDGQLYRLHRYVVMPNHVHALIQPLVIDAGEPVVPTVATIMKRLKGFTARRANQILGRKGTFWQGEYFDHGVRDDMWCQRFTHYIDSNPVLAGLSARAEDWPWGSAGESMV